MRRQQIFGAIVLLAIASLLVITIAPTDHRVGEYRIRASIDINGRRLFVDLKTKLSERDGFLIQESNSTVLGGVNYSIRILGLDSYARRPGNYFWAYVDLLVEGERVSLGEGGTSGIDGKLIPKEGSYEPMRVVLEHGRIKLEKAIRVNTRLAFYLFLIVIVLWAVVALDPLIVALLIPVVSILIINIPAQDVLVVFWDPAIALIFGAFVIAYSMDKSGLAKRIAYILVSKARSPARLMFSISIVSFFLAMWMSSLATMVVMLPIISTILKVFNADQRSRYAKGITLSVMLGAILGGAASIVGNPANALSISIIYRLSGERVEFLEWIAYALPVCIGILIVLDIMIYMTYSIRTDMERGYIRFDETVILTIKAHLMGMGPLTRMEKATLLVFIGTILGWFVSSTLAIMGYVYYLHVSAVALAAVLALIAMGIFKVEDMRKIRWDILLILGGSLSLVVLMDKCGIIDILILELRGVNAIWMLAMVVPILYILSIILGPMASVALVLPILITSGGFTKQLLIYITILSSTVVFGPQGLVLEEHARGRGFITYRDYIKIGVIYTVLSIAMITPLVFLSI